MDVLRTSRMQIEFIWGQQPEDEGNGILGQDSDGSGLDPWVRLAVHEEMMIARNRKNYCSDQLRGNPFIFSVRRKQEKRATGQRTKSRVGERAYVLLSGRLFCWRGKRDKFSAILSSGLPLPSALARDGVPQSRLF
jgi:hypothetical protein